MELNRKNNQLIFYICFIYFCFNFCYLEIDLIYNLLVKKNMSYYKNKGVYKSDKISRKKWLFKFIRLVRKS